MDDVSWMWYTKGQEDEQSNSLVIWKDFTMGHLFLYPDGEDELFPRQITTYDANWIGLGFGSCWSKNVSSDKFYQHVWPWTVWNLANIFH